MKKLIEKLYNYFKKKYLRDSHDYEKIFMQAFIDTYNPNTICLIGLFSIDWELQLDNKSIRWYTVWVKRPGMFIGRSGKDFNKMKKTLQEYTGETVDINIKEV